MVCQEVPAKPDQAAVAVPRVSSEIQADQCFEHGRGQRCHTQPGYSVIGEVQVFQSFRKPVEDRSVDDVQVVVVEIQGDQVLELGHISPQLRVRHVGTMKIQRRQVPQSVKRIIRGGVTGIASG